MAYFWLVQNRSGRKSYQDEEGKVYHYRGTVGGADKLSEGDLVVLYDSYRYSQVIFGAGRVTRIEGYLNFEGPESRRPVDEIPRSGEDLLKYLSDFDLDEVPLPEETVAEYFAHIAWDVNTGRLDMAAKLDQVETLLEAHPEIQRFGVVVKNGPSVDPRHR